MNSASLYFYGSLSLFLLRQRRDIWIEHHFEGQPSVKDMVESLGVPHPEIEHIVVSGRGVEFSYLVRNGDRIEVYPAGLEIDAPKLRPIPPDPPRFVLDIHLGRLAAHLRMLGFNTLWRNDIHDEELAYVSSNENRILLTRDVGLLKRGIVAHGYFVRETNPKKQLAEIASYYDLLGRTEPFKRCIKCNGLLITVSKDEIGDRLPANTVELFDDFRVCGTCNQIYWRGSHLERMEALIQDLHGK